MLIPSHSSPAGAPALLMCAFLVLMPAFGIKTQIIPDRDYRPIVLDTTYEHTRWGVYPGDIVFQFAAYTTSFDSQDDDNDDDIGDIWGIPEWVAYEIKALTKPKTERYARPKWITSDSLHRIRVAPDDDTYYIKGTTSIREYSPNARFVRGHMCPKDAADRISEDAGYNTHTILNAVPQLQLQNNGVWKQLEEDITDWADKYGRVWVYCGPIFFRKTPSLWLGQDGEVRAAVPDALYKIVVRELRENEREDDDDEREITTLAFIIPNILTDTEEKYSHYVTSIARIEDLTDITFLTALDEITQSTEKTKNLDLTEANKRKTVERW